MFNSIDKKSFHPSKSLIELKKRIRMFAKNKEYFLKESFIDSLSSLYSLYNEEVEFITHNQELCKLFKCGVSRTKQVTQTAQRIGLLKKEVKTHFDSRGLMRLHCKLAKLPELDNDEQLRLKNLQTRIKQGSKKEIEYLKVIIKDLSNFRNPPFEVIKLLCECVQNKGVCS